MAKKKGNSLFKFIITIVILVCVFNAVKNFFSGNNTNTTGNDNTTIKDPDETVYSPTSGNYTTQWTETNNTQQPVDTASNKKYEKKTEILGNNKDTVTIMVYMCGTDLESRSYMATYDLTEMAAADFSDNVNVIVFTGGCSQWHVNGISSQHNMIIRITGDNKYETLVENAGNAAMTDPANLTSFIEYCADNFPANRYELIMWDHGGGTISGYGYDEKFGNDSMTLSEIDKALTDADVDFDFIGFDACLMATTENALMLAEHGDYLIASEESEPGIGWYYTDWLNAINKNSSLTTVELGKEIVDSFVNKCATDAKGQAATLSVVDLAELANTVPAKLDAFAGSVTGIINDGDYQTVSSARAGAREFGSSCYADMVDLIDLANKIDNKEAEALKKALLSCVKYNNTSKNMSNSYGLSIYFPYRSTSSVNTVLKTYDEIDMNSSYGELVSRFAQLQTSGQIASGGSHSSYSIFDDFLGYSNNYETQSSYDDLYGLFDLFMGSGSSSSSSSSSYDYDDFDEQYSGSYGDYADLLSLLFKDNQVDKSIVSYINENHFDGDLMWKDNKITLTDKQWDMITDITLNVFVDDGEGYIDMGTDNIYTIKDNSLQTIDEMYWVVASADNQNWQPVAYYYLSSLKDGDNLITYGRIPVLLNGTLANVMVQIDDEGFSVIGATYDYKEIDVVAKNIIKLSEGDTIQFVCDYYNYDGTFNDAYILGDTLTIADQLYLGDGSLGDAKVFASYQLKDIYQQTYWTEVMPQ